MRSSAFLLFLFINISSVIAQEIINNKTYEERFNYNKDLFYSALAAADIAVPSEYEIDIREKILPAISFLCDTDIIKQFGEIVSIKISLRLKEKQYINSEGNYNAHYVVNGYKSICKIKLERMSSPLKAEIGSYLPSSISSSGSGPIAPSYANMGMFYYPILKKLPELTKYKIADSRSFDYIIRLYAIKLMNDISLLSEISARSRLDMSLRDAADLRIKEISK